MKTAATIAPPAPALADSRRAADAAWAGLGGKAAALVELTKPRIAVLVLVTVAAGFLLGARARRIPGRWG